MTVPGNTRRRHSYDALMSPSPDMSFIRLVQESYPPLDFMQLYDMPAIVNPDEHQFVSMHVLISRMVWNPDAWYHVFDGDELRGKTFGIKEVSTKPSMDLLRMLRMVTTRTHQQSCQPSPRWKGANIGYWWYRLYVTGAHGNFEDQGGEKHGGLEMSLTVVRLSRERIQASQRVVYQRHVCRM